MAHRGYPLLGDPVYGGRLQLPQGMSPEDRESVCEFKRQALHAHRLCFTHPATGQAVRYQSPMPDDLSNLVQALSPVQ